MTEIGMALSNPYRGERRPRRGGPAVARRGGPPQGRIRRHRHRRGRAGRDPGPRPGRVPRLLGIAPRRARSRSRTAGSGPATWRSWSGATTGSWAGSRWTSSRAAATSSPRWRSRPRCWSIPTSTSAPSSACPTTPGARPLPPPWCCKERDLARTPRATRLVQGPALGLQDPAPPAPGEGTPAQRHGQGHEAGRAGVVRPGARFPGRAPSRHAPRMNGPPSRAGRARARESPRVRPCYNPRTSTRGERARGHRA